MLENCWKTSSLGEKSKFYVSKKDLSNIIMDNIRLVKGNKIFISQSHSSYYKMLLSKGKALHKMGKLFAYYVSNRYVKFKMQDSSRPLIIPSYLQTHVPGC